MTIGARDAATGFSGRPGGKVRPLSFAQEQLWFLDQLAPGSAVYNILLVWRLHGPLRVDVLQRCVNLLVSRHEALRLTIADDDGTPYQMVTPVTELPLPVADLRVWPEAEREQRLKDAIDAQRAEGYDLPTGPLCRFRLIQLADDEYIFSQCVHHIIADGWSMSLMAQELSATYGRLCEGAEPVFGERQLDYTEFALAQRERLQGDALAGELAFWQRRLAGLPVLELPADRPRPVGDSYQGSTVIASFPADLRGILQRLADDHNASLFMVIAAAYSLVLSRYTGLDDIPTGVPMLGRPEPELEVVVGMFVNMVVLRTDLAGDPAFSELIDGVADASLELYEHQEVSFKEVVDAVQPVRDPDRNPLFQVSLQVVGDDNSGESLALAGVATEFLPQAAVGSRFDIAVTIKDNGSSLRANVEYSAMFDRWRVEAMLVHLETVLRTAAAHPSLRLSQIPMVTGAEREQLLAAGRGDVAGYSLPSRRGRQVYVVDRAMNLVPRGVAGELLVAGEPEGEEPRKEPVDDPFCPGRQAYLTGDLARWTSDLRLDLLGRPGQDGRTATEATSEGGSQARTEGGGGSEEPSTPTEQAVANIFATVLSLPKVGADDSFFSSGGNSLKAMLAVSRINKGFGIKLGVRTLYGNVTVRAVSAVVDERIGGSPA
ncbi:MAG TPA: condensation domain-containing protein [Streptosporangiaceae bacterium]|nr:condensation domain-containing protein [Streptosporangiaceae bacterium]